MIFLTPTGVVRYLSGVDFDQEFLHESDIADEVTNGNSSPTSATLTSAAVPVHPNPSFTYSSAFEFGFPTALPLIHVGSDRYLGRLPMCQRLIQTCPWGQGYNAASDPISAEREGTIRRDAQTHEDNIRRNTPRPFSLRQPPLLLFWQQQRHNTLPVMRPMWTNPWPS